VVYTYSCREKLHIIFICTNGLWAVRSSVSAVCDVRKHCANKNRYNTTHKAIRSASHQNVQQTTNCMQHSAAGEANSSTASQQMWNRKVHCRLHNSPALVPVLNKTNPTMFPRPSIYLTSILILSSHLRQRPSSGFLPLCCPPKIHNLYFKHVSCGE
jgi:hypothetical protein